MLDSFSYLSLSLVCFLASTILPLGSEALVVAFVLKDFNPINVLIVATIANSAGSLTTYALAYYGVKSLLDKYLKKTLERAYSYQRYVSKYGVLLAFFTFLPIVGDVFALALGLYRYNFIKSIIFISLGKFTRYSFLIYSTLYFEI